MPIEINGIAIDPQVQGVDIQEVTVTDGSGTTTTVYERVNLGETVALGTDNASDTTGNESGVFGQAKAEITGFRATLSSNYGGDATYAISRDGNGNALSPQVDISGKSAGDTIEVMFDSSRTSGQSVSLQIARGDGASYGRGRNESAAFPFSGAELDIENGVYSSAMALSSANRYNFSDITPILP